MEAMISAFKHHFELICWLSALVLLYFMPAGEGHYSFCLYHNIGLNWCPGCGIGHSIHHYLHFRWAPGWEEHYMGAFALLILLYRILQLTLQIFKTKSIPYA